MALTVNQVTSLIHRIHLAYSQARLPMGWQKTDPIAEIQALDTFFTNNAATINNQFSAGFRAKTVVSDRVVIFAIVALARLRTNPEYGAVIRAIVNDLFGED